ncbi:MAG: alpha-hydroxy-acid oxidizing protein [Chloroflexi bacterium]|nr:alpha-hydroxy-acid oxidizing protein [Chloroflexota bacterium]
MWRLPRAIFDYVDGGAEDEVTMRANREAFQRYRFRPRVLVDCTTRDQTTTVLGHKLSMPVVIAPTGFAGLNWPQGEIVAARAAAAAGTVFTLSTMSINTIEEVAQGADGPLWFQLYVMKDREMTRALVDRARAAGYKALMLTVDFPVAGQRERDFHSGFMLPPRITPKNVLDTVWRIPWITSVLRGPRLTLGNLIDAPGTAGNDAISLGEYTYRSFDPSVSWKDLDWFRSIWEGPLILKGIQDAADARLAAEHGVQAIVVSNHGGRQLDGSPATLDVLPEVADAAGDRVEVLLDGGVRRGGDVVKAVALGARAVLVGRPMLYGLAAGGQAGVERSLDILSNEIDRTLALIGRPSIHDVDRTALRPAGPPRAVLEAMEQAGESAKEAPTPV